MNLRAKIFLIFSVTATIPLLILTLFSYQRYTQASYERMDDISGHLFENAVKQTNRTLEGIQDISFAFNFYYTDGSSIIEELKKYSDQDKVPTAFEYYKSSNILGHTCQNLLLANENLYGIYIFTPSGYVFDYSTNENGTVANGYAFEDDDWYRQTLAMDGKYYISPVANHPFLTGERDSVFFSRCLKDVYSHKIMGVLLADCDPAMFDMSEVNTLPDITLLTVDNALSSDVLYTNYSEEIHRFSQDNQKKEAMLLDLSPLRLSMTVDYESLFREFNVTGMLMILIGGICIVGLIMVFYLISGYIVKPIAHLSRKMASQTGHTLIQSTRYLDRTDEIGTLYNEYNAMVESLNSAVKQDYQDKLVLLDAQMKSLESRINSHFLFNTLEAINSMAELSDNAPIATMSQALGNLFRYTLKTQSERVTVEVKAE